MEEQGDLRSGAVGTEGSARFQPLSPVTRSPAPEFQAPRRQRASHHGKQVSRGAPGTAWALSRRERVPVPRESPGESPRPGRRGCRCLPRAPTMGPGPALPRPWFAAGECLLRTPRTGGRRFPHRGGGSSSGGLRSQRSHSIFGCFCTDWRVEAAGSKSAALWQGGGVAGEARLLASQQGHRPDSRRENRSVDQGSARPDPLHLARNRGRPLFPAPLPGPTSLVLPGHSASAGVGELLGRVVHGGKRLVLWVAGRASLNSDSSPGTL